MTDSARSARDPLYTHDCPSCVYLGTTRDDEEGDVDLYVHPQDLNGSAVARSYIARYGDESEDYFSAHSFTLMPEKSALWVANERSEAIGIPRMRAS